MVWTCTSQERATAATLRVSWILAKKKRPFTDSETMKECMLSIVDEVLNDDRMKTSVTSAIKKQHVCRLLHLRYNIVTLHCSSGGAVCKI